jgi:hypothetical protein
MTGVAVADRAAVAGGVGLVGGAGRVGAAEGATLGAGVDDPMGAGPAVDAAVGEGTVGLAFGETLGDASSPTVVVPAGACVGVRTGDAATVGLLRHSVASVASGVLDAGAGVEFRSSVRVAAATSG